MVRTLLEACRAAGDSDGALRVQAAMGRRGLTAEVPVAMTVLQGSERQWETGIADDSAVDARKLWLKLRRQTAYKPHFQALPWSFVQSSTREQQGTSLQLHPEKKALA